MTTMNLKGFTYDEICDTFRALWEANITFEYDSINKVIICRDGGVHYVEEDNIYLPITKRKKRRRN